MFRRLSRLFVLPRPPYESEWEPYRPFFPVRLETGRRSSELGQVWRRRHEGRWIYRQDKETVDEYLWRQY